MMEKIEQLKKEMLDTKARYLEFQKNNSRKFTEEEKRSESGRLFIMPDGFEHPEPRIMEYSSIEKLMEFNKIQLDMMDAHRAYVKEYIASMTKDEMEFISDEKSSEEEESTGYIQNKDGEYQYKSLDGVQQINLPLVLRGYKEWLIKKGIVKKNIDEKKIEIPPFTSYMDDNMFEWLSLVQRFVYRCIRLFGIENLSRTKLTESRRKLMIVWFDKLFHNSNLGSVRFTYDETLWPCDVEHGSVFVLAIQPTKHVSYYIFKVDLNKKYDECVEVNGGLVNIFKTEFFPPTYE